MASVCWRPPDRCWSCMKGASLNLNNALSLPSASCAFPSLLFLNGPFTRHLANFIKENPDISLSISYSDLREDIIADSIDVAFRIGELPDSSLKARHLFVLPRQLVASKDLLMQHQPIKHPVELGSLPWIGLTMRENIREFRHKTANWRSLSMLLWYALITLKLPMSLPNRT